ncbi:MAG: DUF2568 domain-containing protein [Thermomicrobiales bacterium]
MPPESIDPTVETQTPGQQPLIGRLVHLAVVLGVIAGCGILGWAVAGGLFGSALTAFIGVGVVGFWWGTSAEHDPERSQLARITLPGPIRLALEIVLIITAGAGIWMVWNRAAGETFLTVATIDFFIRYPRISALLKIPGRKSA